MGDGSGVALAAIGVLATCVGGLIWVIKRMFDRIEPLINQGIKASTAVANSVDASIKQDAAREERDVERHEQSMAQFAHLTDAVAAIPGEVAEIVTPLADRNLEAIQNVNVEHQTVEHQTVRHEVVNEQITKN